MPSPIIKLNSGYDMPQVGFGLWKVDNAVASDVVYEAIKAGYRLFDGAAGMFPLALAYCFPFATFCVPGGNWPQKSSLRYGRNAPSLCARTEGR